MLVKKITLSLEIFLSSLNIIFKLWETFERMINNLPRLNIIIKSITKEFNIWLFLKVEAPNIFVNFTNFEGEAVKLELLSDPKFGIDCSE